ncbi:MAG: membrane protein insertion efficiency factor YidD [candidate division Zixibacteria bacterium]|nr:membrane protein insertion efficiency factor YidD [candidate division Zixibacteria bacterium]
MKKLPAKILASLVRFYQFFLSPVFSNGCRYYPSCSEYARQAILTHGAVKGTGLGFWRILRCNPWSRGGYDPVKQ